MATAPDVARYILGRRGLMSAMKLQKLVYYSQGWHLAFEGEPLFDAPIEAWANGPVVPELYAQHRGLFTVKESTFTPGEPLTVAEQQTVDAVLVAYGDLDAHQLSNLTHNERPWLEARRGVPDGARSNSEIDRATMLEFYEQVLRTAQAG